MINGFKGAHSAHLTKKENKLKMTNQSDHTVAERQRNFYRSKTDLGRRKYVIYEDFFTDREG